MDWLCLDTPGLPSYETNLDTRAARKGSVPILQGKGTFAGLACRQGCAFPPFSIPPHSHLL